MEDRMDRNTIIENLLLVISYAEEQHASSGGEILEELMKEDFVTMRRVVETVL